MAKKLLWVLMFVILSLQVFAVGDVLDISCQASASEVDCGDSVVYSCDIVVYHDSPLVKVRENSVIFTIGSSQYIADLVNGTYFNGTYEVNLTSTPSFAGRSFDFLEMQAQTTDNDMATCVATDDRQSVECNVEFSNQFVNNVCSCTWTAVEGSCSASNTRTTTWTANHGSCSPYDYTVEEKCDYCDPEWVYQLSDCSEGFMRKIYYEENPSCCFSTQDYGYFNHYGGATDCSPPVDDGQKIQCFPDEWTYAGKTEENWGYTNVAGFTLNDYDLFLNDFSPDEEFFPLIVDFDLDGKQEVVAFGNSEGVGYVKYMDGDLSTLDIQQTGEITGQPGLTFDGRVLVPSGQTIFIYKVGTFTEIEGESKTTTIDLGIQANGTFSLALTSGETYDGSGIICRDRSNICFIKSSGNKLVRMDLNNMTNERQTLLETSEYSDFWLYNTPILLDVNSDLDNKEIIVLAFNNSQDYPYLQRLANGQPWYWITAAWTEELGHLAVLDVQEMDTYVSDIAGMTGDIINGEAYVFTSYEREISDGVYEFVVSGYNIDTKVTSEQILWRGVKGQEEKYEITNPVLTDCATNKLGDGVSVEIFSATPWSEAIDYFIEPSQIWEQTGNEGVPDKYELESDLKIPNSTLSFSNNINAGQNKEPIIADITGTLTPMLITTSGVNNRFLSVYDQGGALFDIEEMIFLGGEKLHPVQEPVACDVDNDLIKEIVVVGELDGGSTWGYQVYGYTDHLVKEAESTFTDISMNTHGPLTCYDFDQQPQFYYNGLSFATSPKQQFDVGVRDSNGEAEGNRKITLVEDTIFFTSGHQRTVSTDRTTTINYSRYVEGEFHGGDDVIWRTTGGNLYIANYTADNFTKPFFEYGENESYWASVATGSDVYGGVVSPNGDYFFACDSVAGISVYDKDGWVAVPPVAVAGNNNPPHNITYACNDVFYDTVRNYVVGVRAGSPTGIWMYDVSTPSNPKYINGSEYLESGLQGSSGNFADISEDGRFLAVAETLNPLNFGGLFEYCDSQPVKVFDLSKPKEIYRYTELTSGASVSWHENFLVTACGYHSWWLYDNRYALMEAVGHDVKVYDFHDLTANVVGTEVLYRSKWDLPDANCYDTVNSGLGFPGGNIICMSGHTGMVVDDDGYYYGSSMWPFVPTWPVTKESKATVGKLQLGALALADLADPKVFYPLYDYEDILPENVVFMSDKGDLYNLRSSDTFETIDLNWTISGTDEIPTQIAPLGDLDGDNYIEIGLVYKPSFGNENVMAVQYQTDIFGGVYFEMLEEQIASAGSAVISDANVVAEIDVLEGITENFLVVGMTAGGSYGAASVSACTTDNKYAKVHVFDSAGNTEHTEFIDAEYVSGTCSANELSVQTHNWDGQGGEDLGIFYTERNNAGSREHNYLILDGGDFGTDYERSWSDSGSDTGVQTILPGEATYLLSNGNVIDIAAYSNSGIQARVVDPTTVLSRSDTEELLSGVTSERGIAFADMTQDGYVDAYESSPSGIRIYLSEGYAQRPAVAFNKAFCMDINTLLKVSTSTIPNSPVATKLTAADVDGDSYLDLVSANSLFSLNKDDLIFQLENAFGWVIPIDINSDLILDLIFFNN